MARTSDALAILRRLTGSSRPIKAGIARAKMQLEIAQRVYDARMRAGLSQSEFAALLGLTEPVIAQLEDGDY